MNESSHQLGTLSLKLSEVFSQQVVNMGKVHNTWYLENIQQGQIELICEWKGPAGFLKNVVKKRGDLNP